MRIQCADGIIDTQKEEIGKFDQPKLGIVYVARSREDVKAGRGASYQTKTATMADVQAFIDAQIIKRQPREQVQADVAKARAERIAGLSDTDLNAEIDRYIFATMNVPADLSAEKARRGLTPAVTVDTGAFGQYVELREQAEQKGRLSDFEDGIMGEDTAQGDGGVEVSDLPPVAVKHDGLDTLRAELSPRVDMIIDDTLPGTITITLTIPDPAQFHDSIFARYSLRREVWKRVDYAETGKRWNPETKSREWISAQKWKQEVLNKAALMLNHARRDPAEYFQVR